MLLTIHRVLGENRVDAGQPAGRSISCLTPDLRAFSGSRMAEGRPCRKSPRPAAEAQPKPAGFGSCIRKRSVSAVRSLRKSRLAVWARRQFRPADAARSPWQLLPSPVECR